MQKPYIKKICDISKFSVWLVDSVYIRNNIDVSFTNFGQHYKFKFIPKNEFWVSSEGFPEEKQFFIDHLLVEHRLMSRGVNYDGAFDKAAIIEKRERRKIDFLNKKFPAKPRSKNYIDKIHKKLLKEHSKNVKVWIVDGEFVRDLFTPDYREGGHDKVYWFIPKNEIWLDDELAVRERKFILLHELHERYLMSKKKMKYTRAHNDANKAEYFCRHHPKQLDKKLKEEIGKNNKI